MTDHLSVPEAKIREAIARFMASMDRDPNDEFVGLRTLAISLDNLVAVYFETDDVEPDGEVEPPPKDTARFLRQFAAAFPELGLYPYADPGGDPGEEIHLVADAIDDLGDIAGDLDEVLWYFENSTNSEAIWHFRWGYQNHWGEHLHSLRSYLHSSRIAAW